MPTPPVTAATTRPTTRPITAAEALDWTEADYARLEARLRDELREERGHLLTAEAIRELPARWARSNFPPLGHLQVADTVDRMMEYPHNHYLMRIPPPPGTPVRPPGGSPSAIRREPPIDGGTLRDAQQATRDPFDAAFALQRRTGFYRM